MVERFQQVKFKEMEWIKFSLFWVEMRESLKYVSLKKEPTEEIKVFALSRY